MEKQKAKEEREEAKRKKALMKSLQGAWNNHLHCEHYIGICIYMYIQCTLCCLALLLRCLGCFFLSFFLSLSHHAYMHIYTYISTTVIAVQKSRRVVLTLVQTTVSSGTALRECVKRKTW